MPFPSGVVYKWSAWNAQLLNSLFFYSAFNIDAITVSFPGMRSRNPQILLLLFWTTIQSLHIWLDLPTFPPCECISFFMQLNSRKKRRKWRESHLTFTLFRWQTLFHLQLPYKTQIKPLFFPIYFIICWSFGEIEGSSRNKA